MFAEWIAFLAFIFMVIRLATSRLEYNWTYLFPNSSENIASIKKNYIFVKTEVKILFNLVRKINLNRKIWFHRKSKIFISILMYFFFADCHALLKNQIRMCEWIEFIKG